MEKESEFSCIVMLNPIKLSKMNTTWISFFNGILKMPGTKNY